MKEVAGYPGYFLTEDGRVFSDWALRNQFRPRRRLESARELLGTIGKNGYRVITLIDMAGKQLKQYVHILVAEAFKGSRPEWAEEVRHFDGNKQNCAATNLLWGTCKENAADRLRHGHHRVGSAVKNAKLTEAVVPLIRIRLANGEVPQSIATELGVSKAIIYQLKRGQTWKHVA